MATLLLWKSLRPNIAPTQELIEYITKLIGNEIPSLNRVAITSLTTIIDNYLPLLHYKNVIKDCNKYTIEHTFKWWQSNANTININDLTAEIHSYMRNPRAQLDSQSASIIHKYLCNNLDILCKAFADDHPNIVDPSAPQQNRRSSDTQLRSLIRMSYLWPYDGYDVTLNWWEHTHYILVRDILRCQCPTMAINATLICGEWLRARFWRVCYARTITVQLSLNCQRVSHSNYCQRRLSLLCCALCHSALRRAKTIGAVLFSLGWPTAIQTMSNGLRNQSSLQWSKICRLDTAVAVTMRLNKKRMKWCPNSIYRRKSRSEPCDMRQRY